MTHGGGIKGHLSVCLFTTYVVKIVVLVYLVYLVYSKKTKTKNAMRFMYEELGRMIEEEDVSTHSSQFDRAVIDSYLLRSGIKDRDDRSSGIEILMTDPFVKINPILQHRERLFVRDNTNRPEMLRITTGTHK
jgi:hypothetical protein